MVIRRNLDTQPRQETLDWNIDIPHLMCESYFDYLGIDGPVRTVDLPLNVQVGLEQITKGMEDELVIEILDCDMFHIRKFPEYRVRDDELIVADMYEPWHLCSLGKHRNVIDIYFENGGRFYNGGFVPIICKVRTLRKILPEWIAVHRAFFQDHLILTYIGGLACSHFRLHASASAHDCRGLLLFSWN